jgi:hypothetical protein
MTEETTAPERPKISLGGVEEQVDELMRTRRMAPWDVYLERIWDAALNDDLVEANYLIAAMTTEHGRPTLDHAIRSWVDVLAGAAGINYYGPDNTEDLTAGAADWASMGESYVWACDVIVARITGDAEKAKGLYEQFTPANDPGHIRGTTAIMSLLQVCVLCSRKLVTERIIRELTQEMVTGRRES